MTRSILLFVLSGLLITASAASLFPASGQEPAVAPAQEPEEEETVIEKHMKVFKGNLRQMRRGLRDAEGLPEALPLIIEMQEAAQVCKLETPMMAADVPAEQRKKFLADYRNAMIATQRLLLDFEEACLAGNLERCQELYNALKDAQDDGHDRFTNE